MSLPIGERQRLASLLAAVANVLLLMFVLAVALPLLPLKLADPFWQLAFTGVLCSNGFLALFVVLLANLAAIQAPLLSAADQRLGLPAIQADLLAQLKAQESPSGSQAGPPVPRGALIKDSLRVLLLSVALAMGFAVGARRRSLAEGSAAERGGVVGAVVPG